MASNHTVVARTIRQFVDDRLSSEAIARQFGIIARSARDDLIRSGQASEQYRTFVDGREGVPEERTRPGGATVYKFSLMGALVRRALEELRKASPRESGDFMDAWVVAVNGMPWRGDYDDIPQDADVVIVNIASYSRKVEVGAMTISVPAHPIERVRQRLLRAFPSTYFGKTFVTLPPSFGSSRFPTPYILQGHSHLQRAKENRRSSAFRSGRAFLSPRSDTRKGQQLTYPALSISTRR